MGKARIILGNLSSVRDERFFNKISETLFSPRWKCDVNDRG